MGRTRVQVWNFKRAIASDWGKALCTVCIHINTRIICIHFHRRGSTSNAKNDCFCRGFHDSQSIGEFEILLESFGGACNYLENFVVKH